MAYANQEIREIANKIMETVECEQIYLFGSYAYGVPKNGSDYDLYMVIPDNTIRPLEAIKKAYGVLAKTKMNTPIDVLAMSSTRFRERSNMPTLEGKVAREGIALYE